MENLDAITWVPSLVTSITPVNSWIICKTCSLLQMLIRLSMAAQSQPWLLELLHLRKSDNIVNWTRFHNVAIHFKMNTVLISRKLQGTTCLDIVWEVTGTQNRNMHGKDSGYRPL